MYPFGNCWCLLAFFFLLHNNHCGVESMLHINRLQYVSRISACVWCACIISFFSFFSFSPCLSASSLLLFHCPFSSALLLTFFPPQSVLFLFQVRLSKLNSSRPIAHCLASGRNCNGRVLYSSIPAWLTDIFVSQKSTQKSAKKNLQRSKGTATSGPC